MEVSLFAPASTGEGRQYSFTWIGCFPTHHSFGLAIRYILLRQRRSSGTLSWNFLGWVGKGRVGFLVEKYEHNLPTIVIRSSWGEVVGWVDVDVDVVL